MNVETKLCANPVRNYLCYSINAIDNLCRLVRSNPRIQRNTLSVRCLEFQVKIPGVPVHNVFEKGVRNGVCERTAFR